MTLREIKIRALKTFVQAAGPLVVASNLTDFHMWQAAATAGGAAALSFLWNRAVLWANQDPN